MCGPLPDDAAMDRVLQKKRLKDKYFKSTERISCGELEKAFLRPSTPRADRYKLGLALIIEGVFNASDSHVGIELPTLSIVDDLDMFYSYPWGRVSYIRIIRGFRRRLGRKFVDATNKKEKAIWAFEAILKIGDRFARRLGHQSPRLLSWTCTKQPQHWTYDAFFKNIKLHVSVTLRPTEAEFGQPCISTLMPFEDRTIPVLDEVARDIIPAQLHPDPLPSGGNVGNSRGECTMVFSGRGSEYDDESRDSEDEGAREATEDWDIPLPHAQTYFPIHAPSTSHVRQGQTSGASLTRDEVEELLLDQRTLIEIWLRTVKLEIMQHVTDEFVKVRDFISTLVPPAPSRSTPPTAQAAKEPTVLAISVHDGNGGDTDPIPECADPQVHGRGFSPLPVDHDEDMDNEMQEQNGGAGMESEPALNGDDGDVAFDTSGKREDDGVASPTGVAEADGTYTTVVYFYFTS
ncbi:Hypothetical predicted protein [Olea europaea subsp. europaea]|uniref:DUF1985 domain-containing protein n=1 Tax=Olea europaea subsp. europaea TaxID=158383 RepID=A0A8S0SZK8_OLEEU|nr:Hypothetical predicted protein [Olea europaea subsp. europaea]